MWNSGEREDQETVLNHSRKPVLPEASQSPIRCQGMLGIETFPSLSLSSKKQGQIESVNHNRHVH